MNTLELPVPTELHAEITRLVANKVREHESKMELLTTIKHLRNVDATAREIAIYSLKPKELLQLMKSVYELSGTNNPFIRDILTRHHHTDKPLSDMQRATIKQLLVQLIISDAIASAL